MIEYLKKSKRHLLAALLITAACCGCTVSKAASDVNVPLRDSNSQPRAALPHDINTTPHTNEVDAILAKLDQKSREIKTYEAKIIYLLRQPVLDRRYCVTGRFITLMEKRIQSCGSILQVSGRMTNRCRTIVKNIFLTESI